MSSFQASTELAADPLSPSGTVDRKRSSAGWTSCSVWPSALSVQHWCGCAAMYEARAPGEVPGGGACPTGTPSPAQVNWCAKISQSPLVYSMAAACET